MKEYPSIPSSMGQSFREFSAYVFDKVDGSNIRVEWTRKRGFYKFGSRTRLLDESDPILGPTVPLFREQCAESLERLARDQRWQHLIVFMEFAGPGSLGGLHVPAEPKTLTLFDICPDKRGISGPAAFLRLCEDLPFRARYLGQVRWTRAYVAQVRAGEISGITFEGVVGKAGEGHKLVMAKAKTQAWVDAIYSRFGPEEGLRIVES